MAFAGPFAGGPPPEALTVETPRLDRFGWAELRRAGTVMAVFVIYVVRALASWLATGRRGRTARAVACGAVVAACERLGPTFVKLGQLMASAPGLFPAPLADAALRCLGEMGPFSAEEAAAVVEGDLGCAVSGLFASFDPVPLSAASVAQVHACVLPDGRDAVVKLQRPGIARVMAVDLRIMYRLARVAVRFSRFARDANLVGAVEDLHRRTCRELNFAVEAHTQDRFRAGICHFGDNQSITAPEVYWDYCGPRVICMERLYGVPLDHLAAVEDRLADTELMIRRAVKVWMEACLLHGPFHGDVHAGNCWALDDGRGAFLDFGIMGELDDGWKQVMRDIFETSVVDNDFSRIARAYKRVGAFPEDSGTDAEIGARMQLVFSPMFDAALSDISVATLLGSVIRSMGAYAPGGTPTELHLIVKQMLYFERYSKALAPRWAMFRDPYIVRNVFPEAAARRAAELGTPFPD